MGDFLKTFYGKAIAGLTIIALIMGIVAEGIVIYTNWEVAKIKTIEAEREAARWHVSNSREPSAEEIYKTLCEDPAERSKHKYSCEKRCKSLNGDNSPLCKE